TTNQGLGTPRPRRAGCRHVIACLAGDGIALAALEAPGQALRDLMDAHEIGRVDAEAGHVERPKPLAEQALALADQDLDLLSLRKPKRPGMHVARLVGPELDRRRGAHQAALGVASWLSPCRRSRTRHAAS